MGQRGSAGEEMERSGRGVGAGMGVVGWSRVE